MGDSVVGAAPVSLVRRVATKALALGLRATPRRLMQTHGLGGTGAIQEGFARTAGRSRPRG